MVLRHVDLCENFHQSLMGRTRHIRHADHLGANLQLSTLLGYFAGALPDALRRARAAVATRWLEDVLK